MNLIDVKKYLEKNKTKGGISKYTLAVFAVMSLFAMSCEPKDVYGDITPKSEKNNDNNNYITIEGERFRYKYEDDITGMAMQKDINTGEITVILPSKNKILNEELGYNVSFLELENNQSNDIKKSENISDIYINQSKRVNKTNDIMRKYQVIDGYKVSIEYTNQESFLSKENYDAGDIYIIHINNQKIHRKMKIVRRFIRSIKKSNIRKV